MLLDTQGSPLQWSFLLGIWHCRHERHGAHAGHDTAPVSSPSAQVKTSISVHAEHVSKECRDRVCQLLLNFELLQANEKEIDRQTS